MKHVLLVGGAGYIGTVLSSSFLKRGYKVTVLDALIYDNQFSVQQFIGDPDYKFIYGDMGKTEDLEAASKGVTDVILLAGLVGDPVTKKYPMEADVINNRGVKHCIDFFNGRGIDKLIFISTCSNYGMIKEDELADENYELKPLSLYAKDKVGNELYLLDKKGKTDYTGVVLRFGTAFGLSARMRFDLTISDFTRSIYFKEELLVFDEHTWRPYCHIRDFARLLDLVIHADDHLVSFEVFNAGGDENSFTKKMIVDQILKNMPDGKISYGSNGDDPRNYRVSFAKVKSRLGFEPEYSVQDGISELIEAFRIGLFSDAMKNRNRYGNYELKYLIK